MFRTKGNDMDANQAADKLAKAASKDTKGKGTDHLGTSMRDMLKAGVSDEVLLTGMSVASGYLSPESAVA